MFLFLSFSAIHGRAADAFVDFAGLEGGERTVAGGPAGDVDGPEGDAGRPRPELHRQKPGKLKLVVGQEAAEQDAGERGHPVDDRRTNFDRIIQFYFSPVLRHKNMSSHVRFILCSLQAQLSSVKLFFVRLGKNTQGDFQSLLFRVLLKN